MSAYKSFKTDARHETEGVWFEYDAFRYRLARAGGANKKFAKTMERLSRPHRRKIERNVMEEGVAEALLRRVYIESVILAWEVRDTNGDWTPGLETIDGQIIPGSPSAEDLDRLLEGIPDLFQQIQDDSNDVRVFLENVAEQDAGN